MGCLLERGKMPFIECYKYFIMRCTKQKLEELAKYLGDNDIIIVKSAPQVNDKHSNKIAVSIHNGLDSYVDYVFEEEVTTNKIVEKDYKQI